MLFNKKTAMVAIASSALLAGCATSNPYETDVVVAPIGGSTGMYDYNYTGGELVSNSDEIKQAAANLASTVYFDFNSNTLSNAAKQTLNQQVAFLKKIWHSPGFCCWSY